MPATASESIDLSDFTAPGRLKELLPTVRFSDFIAAPARFIEHGAEFLSFSSRDLQFDAGFHVKLDAIWMDYVIARTSGVGAFQRFFAVWAATVDRNLLIESVCNDDFARKLIRVGFREQEFEGDFFLHWTKKFLH